MQEKINTTINFYKLCTKLKDTIRTGPKVWNAKRKRIESVAEHIYGVQMLAISIYYQFNYKLDLLKVIYMLAIHELEEIEIGDLAFYQATKEEKLKKGNEAVEMILNFIIGKEEIKNLLNEYNERTTPEAKFAYHCDKLECDIQMKLYDQEGCFDLDNQPNNPIINAPEVRKVLDSEKSISNAWIEFDRSKFENDKNFLENEMAKKYQLNSNYGTPTTIYIMYVNNIPVGLIGLRADIDENWKKWSGNIYFVIRNFERKKGYASKMVELGLQKLKSIGLKEAFVNASAGNSIF